MSDNDLRQQFIDTYVKVFDANDNIKPCGRNITISLIEIAKQLEKNIDFGNNRTGVMNVSNIKALYLKIK